MKKNLTVHLNFDGPTTKTRAFSGEWNTLTEAVGVVRVLVGHVVAKRLHFVGARLDVADHPFQVVGVRVPATLLQRRQNGVETLLITIARLPPFSPTHYSGVQ